jgi:excisionase family DNA binding protein
MPEERFPLKSLAGSTVVGAAVVVEEDRDDGPRSHALQENDHHPRAEELPPILDSHEAAVLLRCSVSHVQGLARDGVVPANRSPAGRWRFSRDALLLWAAGGWEVGPKC